MLPAQLAKRLRKLEGKVRASEGERLALLASTVPADLHIVEIGSYRGQSTCYLASGSKLGNRALVTAIDLWTIGGQRDKHGGDGIRAPYSRPETYQRFLEQVEAMGLTELVTPVVASSLDAADKWDEPIGLLHIDAEHSYNACSLDIRSWSQHVAVGGWVAFHDYSSRFPGVMQAVDERITDNANWDTPHVTGTLYTARRLA